MSPRWGNAGDKGIMKQNRQIWKLWNEDSIDEEQVRLLRRKADEVPIPFSEEAKGDVDTLVEAFLGRNDAVGLAAPQIGMSKRIIVFRTGNFTGDEPIPKNGDDCEVLVNPRITQYRGQEVEDGEGCLSCPYITADVKRWTEIKVRGFDRLGNKINKRYQGYLARVVQHEIDHLEGILIVDRGEAIYYPREKKAFFDRIFRRGML